MQRSGAETREGLRGEVEGVAEDDGRPEDRARGPPDPARGVPGHYIVSRNSLLMCTNSEKSPQRLELAVWELEISGRGTNPERGRGGGAGTLSPWHGFTSEFVTDPKRTICIS